MTHEPDPDAGVEPDALESPAEVETEPLAGVPIGDSPVEVFDHDVEEALANAMNLEDDSLADVALNVVVQMGHVPRTVGKTGTPGEQDFARAVAGHAAARIQQDARTIRVIGADDHVPRSDVFVAVHCDGFDKESAHGASVGFRNDDGRRIATAWKEAYQRLGWSRGFRSDNLTEGLARYYGTGAAARAGTRFAFILEAGFLTNPEDRALLTTEEGQVRCAEAIRQAVTAVLGPPGGGGGQPSTAPPFPGVVLKRGSRGPDVCRVQARLRELGHIIESFPICPFGPQTEKAVIAFQRSRGLDDDGKVGKDTWAALFG